MWRALILWAALRVLPPALTMPSRGNAFLCKPFPHPFFSPFASPHRLAAFYFFFLLSTNASFFFLLMNFLLFRRPNFLSFWSHGTVPQSSARFAFAAKFRCVSLLFALERFRRIVGRQLTFCVWGQSPKSPEWLSFDVETLKVSEMNCLRRHLIASLLFTFFSFIFLAIQLTEAEQE